MRGGEKMTRERCRGEVAWGCKWSLKNMPFFFFLAVPCLAGEFSRTGLTPCYPCPRDYYQPDLGKSYCLSCPFYGTTTVIGARSITDCSSKSNYLCWKKWITGTSKGWPAVVWTQNIPPTFLRNADLPFQPVEYTVVFADCCCLCVM